jgi:protein phosphatase
MCLIFVHLNSASYFCSWIILFCPVTVVLDTAAGVWCDTKSVVTAPRTGRYSADVAVKDGSVNIMRRCRHASVAVGDLIFVYGGLRGGMNILVNFLSF